MRPKNDEKKEAIYEFINEYIKEFGVSPTTQEIADEFRTAKSTVSKLIVDKSIGKSSAASPSIGVNTSFIKVSNSCTLSSDIESLI